MKLAHVLTGTEAVLKINVIPILILIAFALCLSIVKRFTSNGLLSRLYWLDLVPFLAIYIVYEMTMTSFGYSYLAIFILIWMIFGICFATLRVILDGELILKVFWLNFWRISDLYWLIIWIIILIIKLINKC